MRTSTINCIIERRYNNENNLYEEKLFCDIINMKISFDRDEIVLQP